MALIIPKVISCRTEGNALLTAARMLGCKAIATICTKDKEKSKCQIRRSSQGDEVG